MSKNNKIAIVILIVLTVMTAVAYGFMQEDIAKQKERLASAEITVKEGEEQYVVTLESLQDIGAESFEAVLDTSDTDAVMKDYIGVELKNLLQSLGIDIEGKTAVALKAADGYSVAYSAAEVLQDGNVYIAYMEDGAYLDTIDHGGRGPFEAIVVTDTFSNRRCKWLTEIEVLP